ncbi:MAG: TIGR04283 family arsenosugar biosynthesis glycosyltransferase [Candidatus Rokuibacteriota bacterium]
MLEGMISIVIPVRNDAEALRRSLDHLDKLQGREHIEVIVAAADAGADTELAIDGRARLLVPGGTTRAALMNAGATAASGDILWFLHADSLPPRDGLALIEQAMSDEGVVGGAFTHRFSESVWSLVVISFINRVRYRLTRNYYGDQGLFVRATAFRRLGGYPDVALMEDLIHSQRLKRTGGTALIPSPLHTSGRRFLGRGPWRTFVFIVWLLLLHTLGLDTQRYASRWRGPEDRRPGSPGGACRRPSCAS